MKNYEIWHHEYLKDRYMDHLSKKDLEQHTKDIFLNIINLTSDAKIGLSPANHGGVYWMRLWTHILAEFRLRYGNIYKGLESGFMSSVPIPRPENPISKQAVCALEEFKKMNLKSFLLKFGKSKYLKETLKNGVIRICPASHYKDSSLNHAIQDKELEITLQPHPSKINFEVYDKLTKKKKANIKPIDNKITIKSKHDFYVICFSLDFQPRLFQDFDNSDSCLVIHDLKSFIPKVANEFKKLFPVSLGAAGEVNYIDPLNTTINQVVVDFCKHFRYAYQNEFRIAYYLPDDTPPLKPLFLELGDLTRYCKLLELNATS